ncbi:hypothetical protein [Micromonospora sp. ATA51]|uniref:hypothetical protein n=1 Tax=Micromonospora sp. ATA51 TaxID=2806098 RepID=UPI001A5DA647|nr:hypothetical protein [Micromonospora sp. ATA51]MBM0228270.1 hypothetical protein [Micromonospora sp. ATA51]
MSTADATTDGGPVIVSSSSSTIPSPWAASTVSPSGSGGSGRTAFASTNGV